MEKSPIIPSGGASLKNSLASPSTGANKASVPEEKSKGAITSGGDRANEIKTHQRIRSSGGGGGGTTPSPSSSDVSANHHGNSHAKTSSSKAGGINSGNGSAGNNIGAEEKSATTNKVHDKCKSTVDDGSVKKDLQHQAKAIHSNNAKNKEGSGGASSASEKKKSSGGGGGNRGGGAGDASKEKQSNPTPVEKGSDATSSFHVVVAKGNHGEKPSSATAAESNATKIQPSSSQGGMMPTTLHTAEGDQSTAVPVEPSSPSKKKKKKNKKKVRLLELH